MASAGEVPVEIVIAPLTIDDGELRALASLLSAAERQRAESFVFERDRRRYIAGRARLRQFVAARIGACPESVQFVTSARGKPALVRSADAPDLRFNLSHCDDLAAYVFAIGHEVGIDVERVRAIPDADAIAERCFSRRERQAYRALAARDRALGFFNCWTRKEAFVKARGGGLGCALDGFDVSLAPGEPARILRVDETDGAACGWCLIDCPPAPGFVGAIAVSALTRPCEAWSARSTW